MCKTFSFYILFFLSSQLLFSQRTETAILFNNNNRINAATDNDLLFKTDHYYTVGISISSQFKNLKNTPAQLFFRQKKETQICYSGFGLEQRIFTPSSITAPANVKNDRPYAAYFLITNYSTFINLSRKLNISNEIGVGMLGPSALGEETQTYVHKKIGSDLPQGWENQLSNSFLVDYQFRIEKGIFNNIIFNHLTPFAVARVGTLTNKFDLGLILKVGNIDKSLKKLMESHLSKKTLIWEWLMEIKYQRVFMTQHCREV